jgi:carboxyl-terminal processing protease
MRFNKNKLKRIFIIFSLFVLICGSYGIGLVVGRGERISWEKGIIPKIIRRGSVTPKEVDFKLFWDVWDIVNEKYAGEIDHQKMLYGAISGMLEALGDPYTIFMDPEETKKFNQELEGTFFGIGAEVGIKNDKIIIISPLSGTPAEKAGLKPQDIILKINGKDTENMSLDEAVDLIRGEGGTKVTLTISRFGFTEPRDFEIVRETIEIKSVDWESKEDNIAYIEINRFNENTKDDFDNVIKEILPQNPKGIILDLRNNPGGYLDVAIKIASEFIDEGVIVIEQEKDGKEESFQAVGKAKLATVPLVVLINEGSASGSEIVAGAIQDRGKGILIGEKTFGKGSVQEIESLILDCSLRITVAHWLTPSGKSITEQGLEPNIKVQMTDEDYQLDHDPQLDKAIEYLRGRR